MYLLPRLSDWLQNRLRGDRRTSRGGGRRRTDFEPNRGWIPAGALALGVTLLDWILKALVSHHLEAGSFVRIAGDRVALWHVRNDAMILGLYEELPLVSRQVIAGLSGLLGTVLLFEILSRGHRLPPRKRPWAWCFVGLVSGGMLGNLGERAVHWSVTDYLSLRWGNLWLPPGNLADLALFLSIPIAGVVIAFEMEARLRRNPGAAMANDLNAPLGAPETTT